MPIYQYVCPKCNTNFELRQSFNDDTVTICPKCKCESRRLFVPVPIIFKGQGFYVTDSRTISEAQLPAKETEVQKDTSVSKASDTSKPDSLTKVSE